VQRSYCAYRPPYATEIRPHSVTFLVRSRDATVSHWVVCVAVCRRGRRQRDGGQRRGPILGSARTCTRRVVRRRLRQRVRRQRTGGRRSTGRHHAQLPARNTRYRFASLLVLSASSHLAGISERRKTVFGLPSVKRFALCYRSVVCLSATLVHCGQTAERIKMKLVMQVGLGPGHTGLDVDPALIPKKRGGSPNFRPISVVAKWLDRSRCHMVGR